MKTKSRFVRTVWAHVMHFLKKSYRDNIPALAGQSAFFILLSSVPFLMFGFSLFSILTGKTFDVGDLPRLNDETNSVILSAVRFVQNSMTRANSGRVVITAILALWSAGKGMYCITEGIARIYRLPNKHIWITKRIFAMGYTVVMLLMLLVSIGLSAFNVLFAGKVSDYLGLDSVLYDLLYLFLYLLLWVAQALLMTAALKFFLKGKLSDKRSYSMRALLPGMLVTVVAWHLLSLGVMIYLRHFAVSSIYGSLASIMVAMVWIYFLMYILLYGIQLNFIYRWVFRKGDYLRISKYVKKKKVTVDPTQTDDPDHTPT